MISSQRVGRTVLLYISGVSIKDFLIKSPLYDFFGKRSFGQSGEDIVAATEFSKKKKGFYVDIGAFHPKQFSNTYLFYKKGWNGVVVEPNPELIRLHEEVRPRDIHLNVGVGKEESVMNYFMMSDPATNTFIEAEANESVEKAGRKIVAKKPIAVLPLKKILYLNVPKGVEIDLMSIDTEGMDYEVLMSNDWDRYSPKIIICEDMEFDYKDWKKSKVAVYLDKHGYSLLAMTPYSLIFKKR
jgi:FkbM family methyltransferase